MFGYVNYNVVTINLLDEKSVHAKGEEGGGGGGRTCNKSSLAESIGSVETFSYLWFLALPGRFEYLVRYFRTPRITSLSPPPPFFSFKPAKSNSSFFFIRFFWKRLNTTTGQCLFGSYRSNPRFCDLIFLLLFIC